MVTQGESLHAMLLELTTQIDKLLPNFHSTIMLVTSDGDSLTPFVHPMFLKLGSQA